MLKIFVLVPISFRGYVLFISSEAMIGLKSMVRIIDNSGALTAECIQVAKFKSSVGHARVGDEMVVVVKECAKSTGGTANKVSRGEVRRAVLVRAKKELQRLDGSHIRFSDNAAVLLNNKKDPLGSRIHGPVAQECRWKGWARVCSLAARVV